MKMILFYFKGEGSFIRRVGSGRKPRYTQIEEHLRDWIVGLRLKGLVVNNRMILTKAKQLMELDPTMQDLPVPRTGTWVIGFLKRQNLFGLIGTTLGHEDPRKLQMHHTILFFSAKVKLRLF